MPPRTSLPAQNPMALRRSTRLINQREAAAKKAAVKPVISARVDKKVKFNKCANQEFPHRFPRNCKKRSHPTSVTTKPILKHNNPPAESSQVPPQSTPGIPYPEGTIQPDIETYGARRGGIKAGSRKTPTSTPEDPEVEPCHIQPYDTRRVIYSFDYSVPGDPYKTTFTRDPRTKRDIFHTGRKGRKVKSQVAVYLANDLDLGQHFEGLPLSVGVLFHAETPEGDGYCSEELGMDFYDDTDSGKEIHEDDDTV